MTKQLIFVVESTRKANTDGHYLRVLLDTYYKLNRDVKISFIHMDGKGNYNKRSVKKQIDDNKKKFHGESYVFYLLDKDQLHSSAADQSLNLAISKYCEQNDYQTLWFVRTIEHVFLHKIIGKSEKIQCALRFDKKQMKELKEQNLSCPNPMHDETSNILCLLDICIGEYRYFKRTSNEFA